MNDAILINCKDLQLLLRIPLFEAKRIMYTYSIDLRKELSDFSQIRVSHFIDYKKIGILIKSYSDKIDNKKEVQVIIDSIRKNGLTNRLKREVLNNPKNLYKNKLCGNHKGLERILRKEQLADLLASLDRRHKEVYMSKYLCHDHSIDTLANAAR